MEWRCELGHSDCCRDSIFPPSRRKPTSKLADRRIFNVEHILYESVQGIYRFGFEESECRDCIVSTAELPPHQPREITFRVQRARIPHRDERRAADIFSILTAC